MKIPFPLLVTLMFCSLARAADIEQLTLESRQAARALGSELRATLQTDLKSAGPVRAIVDCNVQGPWLTEKLSAEQGMQVGRTSLRTRNDANAPDAWERSVLAQFEQRKAAGEAVSALEYFELTRQDGKQVFRYMKAIPMEDFCLMCHGEQIPPDIAAELGRLYPHDRARGYRKGDIGGAFTVTRIID